MAARHNGSLLISTSARTSKRTVEEFQRQFTVPNCLYDWRADDESNPYFGILALSDELIVTADSISMLGEACATGKPVYMAELGGYGYPMRPECHGEVDFRLIGLTYSWMMRFGPQRLSRDIRLVHRQQNRLQATVCQTCIARYRGSERCLAMSDQVAPGSCSTAPPSRKR
jgi:hypothetical protein